MKGLAGGTFPIKEKISGDSREKGAAVLLFRALSYPEEPRGVEQKADHRELPRGKGHRPSRPEAPRRAEGHPEVERPEE